MNIFININILIALSLLPVAPSHHTPENLGYSFCTALFYRNIIGEDFNMMMMMICCHSLSLVLNMITIMLLKMDNDDAKPNQMLNTVLFMIFILMMLNEMMSLPGATWRSS